MNTMTVEAAVRLLQQVTGAPAKQMANGETVTGCPLCPTDTRHLYISEGDRQTVVISCKKDAGHGARIWAEILRPAAALPSTNGQHAPSGQETVYRYTDARGELQYEAHVVRFGPGINKNSWFERPGPDGRNIKNLQGVPRVLYRLDRLAALPDGAIILFVEGERDVETLEALGFNATTSPGGTGMYSGKLIGALRRFRVLVPFDADRPGVELRDRKLTDLRAAGIECAAIDFGYPITKDHGKDVTDWLREGHTAAELAALIEDTSGEFQFHSHCPPIENSENGTGTTGVVNENGTGGPFPLLTLDELCDLPPPQWQVEGLFQEQSLMLLYGMSGECKSLLTLDLALSMARGCETWFGKQILIPGPVVWVNADGGRGITPRVNAWRAANPGPFRFPFRTLMGSVHLNRPDEMDALREQLMALDPRPVMVVIDTLSRCIPGVKENDAPEMTRVTELCHRLKIALPATVALIHHTDKSGKWDRGSSVVGNESDTKIRVLYDQTARRGVVRCDKERDGAFFKPFGFKLIAQDGSAILVQDEVPAETPSDEKRVRMERLIETLREYGGASAEFLATETLIPVSTVHRFLKQLQSEEPPLVETCPVVNYGDEVWEKQKPLGYVLTPAADGGKEAGEGDEE